MFVFGKENTGKQVTGTTCHSGLFHNQKNKVTPVAFLTDKTFSSPVVFFFLCYISQKGHNRLQRPRHPLVLVLIKDIMIEHDQV